MSWMKPPERSSRITVSGMLGARGPHDLADLLEPLVVADDVAAAAGRRPGAAPVDCPDGEATLDQQVCCLGKPLRVTLEAVHENERRLGR